MANQFQIVVSGSVCVYVTYCLGYILDKITAAKHFEVWTYICGFIGIECTYNMHHLIYLQCCTVCMVKILNSKRRCAELDEASLEDNISYNRHDLTIFKYVAMEVSLSLNI